MTWYRSIKALNPPFDGGVDGDGRVVVLFNIIADKRPSATLIDELAHLISGEINSTLLTTSRSSIPPKGNVVTIIASGGTPPQKTQDREGVAYELPTAIIRVHAERYVDAETDARAAYDVLTRVKNQEVSAT